MTDIVITHALRTPVGAFNGTLSTIPAHDLGKTVIKALLDQSGLKGDQISEVIMGQVLTAGEGQNPARQAALNAGLPHHTTAFLVNQVCGSGLRAIALGAQSILAGQSEIVIAGGQENMSLAPHAAKLRAGIKMGPANFVDTMITDGLWDAFQDYHMGITAENVAEKWQITRQMQDELALTSQLKAAKAIADGKFKDEIVPVSVEIKRQMVTFSQDEYPRPQSTIEALAGLKSAFKKDGTVTAGNSSGINDGAAALVLMTQAKAKELGLKPMARLVSFATSGVDPEIMGTGPIPASRLALKRAGWSVSDLNVVEANEAFAAQACAVNRDLGWSKDIVNVNGGAIAIGHPIGASGARIMTTLLHEMKRRPGTQKGLATMCVGGGMGLALCVESF